MFKSDKTKPDDGMLAQLMSMGFELDYAKKALIKTNNNIDKAIDYLSSGKILE